MKNLLEEYVPRIFRFALRLSNDHHMAEDLTQETMLRAWRHRDRLREPQKAIVWLLRIAANVWLDQMRRRKHPLARAETLATEIVDQTHWPSQMVIGQEDVRVALNALNSLPPRQREVLYLHACENLTHAEIAEVLNIGPDAVKANLSVARKKMRELLKDLIPDKFPTV